MSRAPTIRSFLAVDVKAEVRAALQEFQTACAGTAADVRWVRPQGLHATLKFLGNVETQRLEQVRIALTAALMQRSALRVRMRGLGAFPSLRRPRVLWVGMHGDGLIELAGSVDAALATLGFAREGRAFAPHITLGRVNSLHGWLRLEEIFKAHVDDDWGESEVAEITMYRSTLQTGGAVYAPLWTIPLGRNKEGAFHDT